MRHRCAVQHSRACFESFHNSLMQFTASVVPWWNVPCILILSGTDAVPWDQAWLLPPCRLLKYAGLRRAEERLIHAMPGSACSLITVRDSWPLCRLMFGEVPSVSKHCCLSVSHPMEASYRQLSCVGYKRCVRRSSNRAS